MKMICYRMATYNSCDWINNMKERNMNVNQCCSIRSKPHECTEECKGYAPPCRCVPVPLEYMMREVIKKK